MATLNSAKGLVLQSNELNRPEGALSVADNIVIDYDNVIQSRRGFKEYSSLPFSFRPKQTFEYKNRILVHYAQKLSYDVSGGGVFADYAGTFSELVAGLRIKAVEANGNLYFTTVNGIKKLSVKDSAGLATATVTNAGGIKAIDLQGKLIPDNAGYLPAQSKVAYRLVYGTKDANSNLILGFPSSRLILTNSAADVAIAEKFLVNFLNFAAIVNGSYFLFDSPTQGYVVWFNKTGAGVIPSGVDSLNRVPVEINIVAATDLTSTASIFANKIQAALPTEIAIELTGTEVAISLIQTGICANVAQGNFAPATVLVTKIRDGSFTTGETTNGQLTFTLPSDLTTNYFYQIYRTAIVTVDTKDISATLSDIDPGDEQQFVYEAPITAADITAREITVLEDCPEAFRQSGAYLMTNQFSGGGITQANERPPIATDIALFRNSTFYSNTKDVHRLNLSVLSVDDFISGSSKFYIKQGAVTRTYTFAGGIQEVKIQLDIKSNTVSGSYIVVNSANNERSYYIWFDTTGTSVDPQVPGKLGVRIPLYLYLNTIEGTKLSLTDAFAIHPDFTAYVSGVSAISLVCIDNGAASAPALGTPAPGGTWSVTMPVAGIGENHLTNQVLLSQNTSIGTAIDVTTRSLVRVINKDILSPVTAQYVSGAEDLPGKILFEAKSLEDVDFHIAISSTLLVPEFTPEVAFWNGISAFPITTASDNNEAPNRIYYSKPLQPEAVPIVNYIDVGSKDKAILRILALRDNLFVLKQDGVYIVTGPSAPDFSVRLLDNSAILTAPDTAVVLNNLIFCLTSQGVVSISETGVSIIGRQIEDQIKKVTTFAYQYSTTSFGLAYESDRSYMLWLPTLKADTVATQCFRYNTITSTWTRWTKTNTCGLVAIKDDRIYLGSGTNRFFVEQERKDGERQDYADRNFTRTIGAESIKELSIKLNTVSDIEIGDVLVQEQYLTVPKFNRFLTKLDRDSGPALHDYRSSLEAKQNTNFATTLTQLITKLNIDTNLGTFTAPSGVNAITNLQTDFNVLITELNNIASGTKFKNYTPVTDLIIYEVLIEAVDFVQNRVTCNFVPWFLQGTCEIYKGIKVEVEWAAQHFGSPETTKQIDKGTLIFDQSTIYGGTISYSSDISADFYDIPFTLSGPGFWASYPWLDSVWGGNGNEQPVITEIPRDKSRCRYLHVKFKHVNAREQFKLLGISLEPREVSKRGYR